MSYRTRVYVFATVAVLLVASGVTGYMTTDKTAVQKETSPTRGVAAQVNLDGLFADQGQLYFSPQAPKSTDSVTVTLRAKARNLTSADVVVVDSTTKQETTIAMRKVGTAKNGDYDFWQGTIPPNSNYENYYFVAKNGTDTAYFTGNGATAELPSDGLFAIAPGFTTPSWAQTGVMYQIFVDRFYNGNPQNDVKTGEYTWYGSSTVHLKWNQDPETGDQGGTDQVAFSGGDLEGIRQKLPYVTGQLGANILYLSPVFDAKTNHKYGVDNYFQVDPHLGGNQALKSLISSAHGTGDKVILDGVFNHTGASNVWFQSAEKSKKSPYFNWYSFTNWPTSYATFAGVQNLPKLNYGNRAVSGEIDKVAQYWLKGPYQADGWRLDAAGHVGANGNDPEQIGDSHDAVNHQVWQGFREAVKAANPSALIFGEYWESQVALPWLKGNEWDGSINYAGFISPVSAWITGEDLNMNAASIAPSDLANTLFNAVNSLPRPAELVQVNQLGTHDNPRFGERAAISVNTKDYNGTSFPYGGVPDYKKDALGAILQMTYPGLPTIYYGDEYGMMGGGTNDAGKRWPFDWSKTGNALFHVYQKLITMRKEDSALVDGSFMPLLTDDTNNVFGFARFDGNERIVVLLNASDKAVSETVNASAAGANFGSAFENVTPLLPQIEETNTVTVGASGKIQVNIPANYGVILVQKGSPLY